jgi:hypothetical protein
VGAVAKNHYTLDEVIDAAQEVMQGNRMAVARGDVTMEAGAGAEASVLALMLVLGIDVQFKDGTKWTKKDKIGVQPPKPGKERLN